MTGPALPRSSLPEAAVDGIASALFAVFVGLLVLGYLDSGFPYASVATLPLLGSLATIFWANARADRRARSSPSVPTS